MTHQTTQRFLLRTLLGGLLLGSATVLGGVRAMSGQWEYVMTTDGQPEPRKTTACMSPAEAAAYNGDLATVRAYFEKKQRGPCKIKTIGVAGDTLSYVLDCGDRTIENKVTFHGDTSEGVMVAKTAAGKTQTTHTKARRLGACP